MVKKLEVQKFIEQHLDWEKLLQEKPYCLKISRKAWNSKKLLMLKYSQFDSDFSEPICRECRGIILDEDTLEPVSFPFMKFGNVSEGAWVEKISWDKNPYVLEKVDGSLIKVVKLDGELLVSTNGTILASEAPVAEQLGCRAKTFYDLVVKAIWDNPAFRPRHQHFTSELGTWHQHSDRQTAMSKFAAALDEGFTYMFELTSPWSKVVVPHQKTELWLIGIRNNKTFEETYVKEHPLASVFKTPKEFSFSSLEDCIAAAKELPWNEEGYVVTDRDFKRNKVKSLKYLACHHLKGNGIVSCERAVEVIQKNELAELLAYFPELGSQLAAVKSKYDDLEASLEADVQKLRTWLEDNGLQTSSKKLDGGSKKLDGGSRKKLAAFISEELKLPGLGFAIADGKTESAASWLRALPASKIANMLEAEAV